MVAVAAQASCLVFISLHLGLPAFLSAHGEVLPSSPAPVNLRPGQPTVAHGPQGLMAPLLVPSRVGWSCNVYVGFCMVCVLGHVSDAQSFSLLAFSYQAAGAWLSTPPRQIQPLKGSRVGSFSSAHMTSHQGFVHSVI